MFRKGFIALLFSLYIVGYAKAQTDNIGSTLNDSTLIVYLRNNYAPTSPKNYDEARDSMYLSIDVDESDSLTGVYTGLRAKADGSRTPSNGSLSFNTEHSWPQSFYDNKEPMRGDIHHLFPTWSSPNQSRSNHPFGEVADNLTTSWWYWKNGGSISSIPSENIDFYSEYGNSVFEPREDHKGNAARAMFYFWTLYQTNADIINDDFDNEVFFSGMKDILFQWHQDDPVDAAEVARSLAVESVQGNKNPFIHDTTLVRRAFFYEESSSEASSDIFISEVYEANGGTVKYLELFNNSDSTINLNSGDWKLLRYTNDGTTPSYSLSLTGTIKGKDFYVIGDDNSSTGVVSVFGESLVDLNSSQINHNGNDKYVLIKNASSTADTVDSFAKDNIGDNSNFASNQVAYRIYSNLPNDGSFGQTSVSSNGDTVASGNWVVFNISSSNANAKLIATPGYSKGIESSKKPEALITNSAGWRLIAIPKHLSTIADISDDTAIQGVDDELSSNIFTYNSTGSFNTPATSSTNLENGEGLLVYFYDNSNSGSSELPIVLDVVGNEPDSDVAVTLNTTTIDTDSYFTLVGNPYHSNFDTNLLTSDNPIQSNIHILNNGLYSPEPKSTTVLLPWQGFWVESATSSPATTLTFPTSGKTNSNASLSAFSKLFSEKVGIQFNLKSDKSYDKGCLITFGADHSKGWDIYDASKFLPTTNQYAILGCSNYDKIKSVESFPSQVEGTEVFDLFIESNNVAEELKLEWFIDEPLTRKYDLVLFDHSLNREIPIQGNGDYSFNQSSSSNNKIAEPKLAVSPSYMKADSNTYARFSLSVTGLVSVDSETEAIPSLFSLHQNYPNPFNPSTTIGFQLPDVSDVLVQIFDSKGSLIKVLADKNFSGGSHYLTFDGKNLASGVYFYRITTSFGSLSKPMLLLK
ncbi:MAG: endonuclease [Balneolaceae bacterium]